MKTSNRNNLCGGDSEAFGYDLIPDNGNLKLYGH